MSHMGHMGGLQSHDLFCGFAHIIICADRKLLPARGAPILEADYMYPQTILPAPNSVLGPDARDPKPQQCKSLNNN